MNVAERAALRDRVARASLTRNRDRENAVVVAQRGEIRDLRAQVRRLEDEVASLRRSLDGPDIEGETELDWLTTSDAARLLAIHPNTLRGWANTGKVACFRTPGGDRRFRRVDIEAARHWVSKQLREAA